jgi:plastocyanin
MDRVRMAPWSMVVLMILSLLLAACSGSAAPNAPEATTGAAATPVTVPQSGAPAATAAQSQAPAQTVGGGTAPAPGPNLLAKTWPERLGIIVSELKPASGKPVLTPKNGDLWFFSNSSTAWGATNTKNAVWVIDAKTKQTIAEVAPFDGAGNSSHGIAVSGDGKFIYLPELGKDNHIDVLDGRTLEVVQTIKTLGRPHHQKLWHDPNSNKDLIIGEDFNWSFTGSGFYVLDPSQNNAIVGGLSNGDFEGNPYVSTPAPDGSFIVVTVPAPTAALRDKMDGYLAKVDPKTWKVVGLAPMIDPLWAEVSLDGKYAYVTSGAEARVYKINLTTMQQEGEVQTGPGPWGARISYDQTRLYTADKGEGPGYNQQGRTSTVIDLQTMGVVDVVNIGLTTDHGILSPDGKEIWFTSNAEHAIHVLNTVTNQVSVIKDPADGDIHGGVFVQYTDDGKGNVIGEVVADYSGLHSSALAAERKYVSEPTLTIAFDRNGFLQKSLDVEVGKALRLIVKNVGGTSGGNATFESPDMGIKPIVLAPGQIEEVRWTAPAELKELTAKVSKSPNGALVLSVKQPAAQPAAAAVAAGGPQVVKIQTHNFTFDITNLTVKPGQAVRFSITNGDDEKHNIVGLGEGLNLVSPDVGAGQTVTYDWTAPSATGTSKVICAYHSQMTFTLEVK